MVKADSSKRTPVQLCLFDTRRGKVEGNEIEQVLAYYPASIPAAQQTASVGLAQAMVTLTATFAEVS